MRLGGAESQGATGSPVPTGYRFLSSVASISTHRGEAGCHERGGYRITFICVAVMPYCAGLKFGSLVRIYAS